MTDKKNMETRITPLPESELTDEVKEILRGLERDGQVFNIFRTLARHPKLLKKWLVFANYILSQSTLPARERKRSSSARCSACKALSMAFQNFSCEDM